MTNYQCQIPLFISELKRLLLNEWNIVIVSPTDSEYQQIQGYLSEANILFSEELEIGKVFLSHGTISNGFELSSCKLAVIAAKDILGRQKTKRYNKKKARATNPIFLGFKCWGLCSTKCTWNWTLCRYAYY